MTEDGPPAGGDGGGDPDTGGPNEGADATGPEAQGADAGAEATETSGTAGGDAEATGSGEGVLDGESAITRRRVLGAALLGGAGYAAWELSSDGAGDGDPATPPNGTATPGGPAQNREPEELFDVWTEVQEATRTSPSHLPARAEALVEAEDAEGLYDLVREDVVTLPAGAHSTGDQDLVRWGSRATLRGGGGTMREQAELLAELYERLGYETRLRVGATELSESAVRDLLFSPPELGFDPDVDVETTEEWLDRLDVEAPEDDSPRIDEDGQESAAVADDILGTLEPLSELSLAGSFDFGGGYRPYVVEATKDGETVYADLFSPDATFGEPPGDPSDLSEPPERVGPGTVEVTLTGRRAGTDQTVEFVSGEWSAEELAGRQLRVQTLPTPDPVDVPMARPVDINQFLPILSVQGRDLSREEAEELSVAGEAVTRTGDRVSFTDDGTMLRNGTPVASSPDTGTDGDGTDDGDGDGTQSGGDSPIESLDVEANPGPFPRVQLDLYPRDENGDVIGGLGPDAFDIADNDELVRPTVLSNQPTPRVMVLYDVSLSMPGQYSGEEMQSFIEQLRSDIKSIDERAVVNAQSARPWSDTGGGTRESHLWEFIANAPKSEQNLVVFVTDGEALGEKTQERVEAVRNGPRVIGLDTLTEKEDEVADSLREMAALSDGTALAAQDREATREAIRSYIEEARTELPAHVVEYEAVDQSLGEHSVEVSSRLGDGSSAATTYQVGEIGGGSAEGENYGFDRLNLTITVDRPGAPTRTVERTIAGDDGLPEVQADGDGGETTTTTTPGGTTESGTQDDPGTADDEGRNLPDDVREVEGAMLGETIVSFEGWGAPFAVWLDDMLDARLSFQGMHDELAEGNPEAANEVRKEEGLEAVPAPLLAVQAPYPDAVTEDSLTYPDGLRVAMHHQRLSFVDNAAIASVDVLPTTDVATAAEDAERRFRLTAERTARASVVEGRLFDTAAATTLSDAELVTPDAISDDSARRSAVNAVATRASGTVDGNNPDRVVLVDAGGEGTVHWQVDPNTGGVRGILPDASGGGSKAENIRETINGLKRAMALMGLLISAASAAGAVTGGGAVALGAVAAYGVFLAKLYGIAALAIATMDASGIGDQIDDAAESLICNLAVGIGGAAIKSLGRAIVMKNLVTAAGGDPPSIC